MNDYSVSIRKLLTCIITGVVVTDIIILCAMYFTMKDWHVVLVGGCVAVASILWGLLLTRIFQKKLSVFTSEICLTLEKMMSQKSEEQLEETPFNTEEETLLSRIQYRLNQVHHMMQGQKEVLSMERKELQQLVSDISHQTRTPVTNLKMIQETLLEGRLSETEQREFLAAQGTQIDKLDFLVQAMVKTSRLETGVIELSKKRNNLYETLAEAIGGIFLKARQNQMQIQIECPEEFWLSYDKKWTGEAVFNVLENAVKYTPEGGCIAVNVERWEAYVKIAITDSGKGIPEEHYPLIFQRFYREPDVHEEEGIGIGLFLAREIIMLQGGYMKVASCVGEGTTFSMFLPNE